MEEPLLAHHRFGLICNGLESLRRTCGVQRLRGIIIIGVWQQESGKGPRLGCSEAAYLSDPPLNGSFYGYFGNRGLAEERHDSAVFRTVFSLQKIKKKVIPPFLGCAHRCVLSLVPLCRYYYPNTHPDPLQNPLGVCVPVYKNMVPNSVS